MDGVIIVTEYSENSHSMTVLASFYNIAETDILEQ